MRWRPEPSGWNRRIAGLEPDDAGYRIAGEGWCETFDLVIGADGAWSRVGLCSAMRPTYERVLPNWALTHCAIPPSMR
jgi:2-polyprenyl-6-methoxyphenol hydroxylase-like FAD-dependent oxidoreductase